MLFQFSGARVERNKDLVLSIQVVRLHGVSRMLLENLEDMIQRHAGMDICRYIYIFSLEGLLFFYLSITLLHRYQSRLAITITINELLQLGSLKAQFRASTRRE